MNETMLDDEQLGQLRPVLSSLTVDIELKLILDGFDTSGKLRALADQLAGASDGRITVSADQAGESDVTVDMKAPLPAALPMLRILAKGTDGTMTVGGHDVDEMMELVDRVVG
ncbi:hypothetical protein [Bifidobacterium cuniculi]|uniref:Uncharacterized protein n=1 Tax=Bifidobacterium cuniculi TaxID=1688 RepID=A0A087AYA9_9BIFI|nr:hypothetical protein [Bifidobacterium cuniculi]KFI63759.1 hypothetical protein BCUN_1241 [Bifidobacterium cuniculi]